MKVNELALQRSRYKHLSDDEWRWFLQQVEGRERTAEKLPTFAAIEDWWYPVRLSCEQCSSELTARYKASLVREVMGYGLPVTGKGNHFVDLTAGFGVDTYFLSELFAHTDYVEQNEELCRIATHNFDLPTPSLHKGKEICVLHSTAEDYLSSLSGEVGRGLDLIFTDPARRDNHGGKVFRLEDCTPNMVELLPTLLEHLTPDGRIMLKLSPMLDITQAVKSLSAVSLQWSVYVVAVKNEVKEILLFSHQPSEVSCQTITAIDLAEPEKAFIFTREEERDCALINGDATLNGGFLYEPNAAILKAGAYKLVGQRYGLQKLDVNTHLYVSDTLIENFPGRVWQINSQFTMHNAQLTQANVICRNYPMTPDQLKKKLHLRDGGTAFVIGCRINGKPTVLLAERV